MLSGFRQWDQLEYVEEWLLFPENIRPRLAIDESALSNGELYTFVTNRDACTREQALVAVVTETKSEDVITVLKRIVKDKRYAVEEVTLDLSDFMRKIVCTSFPKAQRVIDRFHIQELACDAVRELRIKHRRDAIQQANDEMEEVRLNGEMYILFRYATEIHAKSCLYAHAICCPNLPTSGLTGRNSVLNFYLKNIQIYKKAYGLCHSLRLIFSKSTIKDAVRLSMARWYNKVEEADLHSFNVIAGQRILRWVRVISEYNATFAA